MRLRGTVKVWKDDKGYGFIAPRGGGEEVFLHVKYVTSAVRPTVGSVVDYELDRDERGRIRATRATLIDDRGAEVAGRLPLWPFAVAVAWYLVLALLVGGFGMSVYVPAVALAMSLLSLIVYGVDKSAAEQREWRQPEMRLHFIDLLGGWPGALVAQQVLRHKSRKQAFQIVFWLTVFANIGAILLIVYVSHTSSVS